MLRISTCNDISSTKPQRYDYKHDPAASMKCAEQEFDCLAQVTVGCRVVLDDTESIAVRMSSYRIRGMQTRVHFNI